MPVKLEYNHLSNFCHCLVDKMRTSAFFTFESSAYLMTTVFLNSIKDFEYFWS